MVAVVWPVTLVAEMTAAERYDFALTFFNFNGVWRGFALVRRVAAAEMVVVGSNFETKLKH